MRACLLAALLACALVPGPVAGVTTPSPDGTNPCIGTITDPPDRATTISIQGAHVTPDGYEKRPALLLQVRPDGGVAWIRNASANGRWWAYDVDPLGDGTYLFATTEPGISIAGRFDPAEGRYRWLHRFDGRPDSRTDPLVGDAHDVDALGDGELVVADKGTGHERLLVYDRNRGRVVWEWRFTNHPEAFPESGGGSRNDWTHVNDVDRVNVTASPAVDATGTWFMASVRNFDSVIFVNRSSGRIERRLGADGAHDVLHRQHNPDHLWGPDGDHVVLVADSLNDRVVEYAYDRAAGEWRRVWTLTGFDEPRDADRLPNGNTLVTDRMGQRVVEVTPEGEVVWEVYTPYEPYDAERGADGSQGPSMLEHGVEGRYAVHGGAAMDDDEIAACASALYEAAPTRFEVLRSRLAGERRDGSLPLVPLAVAGGLLVVGAAVVLAWHRR